MKTQNNVAAEIWLAIGADKWTTLRKTAALVAYDYLIEQHKTGYFSPYQNMIDRLAKRWQIGDWLCALSAHYPIK